MCAHPVANRPQHPAHTLVDAAVRTVRVVDDKDVLLAVRYVPMGRVIVSVCERADGLPGRLLRGCAAPGVVLPGQLRDGRWEDGFCRCTSCWFNAVRACSSHRVCDLFIQGMILITFYASLCHDCERAGASAW